MAVGALELTRNPIYFLMDSWQGRGADFGQFKPADLTAETRDRGREAVNGAIGRIAAAGDELARIEAKGRPVVELAGQYWSDGQVAASDLSARFMTPPRITWYGGGLTARYQPSLDLLM